MQSHMKICHFGKRHLRLKSTQSIRKPKQFYGTRHKLCHFSQRSSCSQNEDKASFSVRICVPRNTSSQLTPPIYLKQDIIHSDIQLSHPVMIPLPIS
uniref:Uncharacterized protein n=1 Tax=Solanum lycopersicum TaxID=4081 RepID=A0A3Q7J1H5_SOLLC